MLPEHLPLVILEESQIHADGLYIVHNLLHSPININVSREGLSFSSEHMLGLLRLLGVIKEIPAERRSHRIELLALLVEFHFVVVELLSIFRPQLLLIVDSLMHVLAYYLVDILLRRRLPSLLLEPLQQDRILNILQHVIIYVFEHFDRVEPNVLILLVEVALPNPIPPILLSLGLVELGLLLRLTHQVLLILILLLLLALFSRCWLLGLALLSLLRLLLFPDA